MLRFYIVSDISNCIMSYQVNNGAIQFLLLFITIRPGVLERSLRFNQCERDVEKRFDDVIRCYAKFVYSNTSRNSTMCEV